MKGERSQIVTFTFLGYVGFNFFVFPCDQVTYCNGIRYNDVLKLEKAAKVGNSFSTYKSTCRIILLDMFNAF